MKKNYGQNFLKNSIIVDKIIEKSQIDKNDEILEIGPGDGELTKQIINKNPKKFVALEIDKSLESKLENLFTINSKFELIFGDALKFNEKNKFKNNYTIISNLPYNISLQLLVKWIHQLKDKPYAKKMILMFQKEVAERIIANINTKKYGRISILCATFYYIKKIIDIDKVHFFPIPKVNSTVLSFSLLKNPKIDPNDIKYLETITSVLFNNRRKKLKKKIQSLFSNDLIISNKLDQLFDLRVESLTVNIFIKLALLLKKN